MLLRSSITTAPGAILSVVTAPSAILAVVTAPSAICSVVATKEASNAWSAAIWASIVVNRDIILLLRSSITTAPGAILAVVTAPSAILAVVTAPSAISLEPPPEPTETTPLASVTRKPAPTGSVTEPVKTGFSVLAHAIDNWPTIAST